MVPGTIPHLQTEVVMSGNTPKPSPIPKLEGGDVIPLSTRRRRDATQEFDTRGDSPSKEHVVVSRRDDTPTDRITVPDGLPPGEAQEIVVELHDLAPVHKNPLDALETMTFVGGRLIRDKSLSRGPVYYEILTGVAVMGGRKLRKGDIIGLVEFVEVYAETPLHVRILDLPKIAAANDTSLMLSVQGRLLGASAELANQAIGENAVLRQRIEEYDAVLRGRLEQLRDQVVRPLRTQLQERIAETLSLHEQLGALTARLAHGEAELAELRPWLEAFFKRDVPELLADLERMRKDRTADAESLELILDEFDEFVEQGVIDESEKRLVELVTIIEPMLDAMMNSGDMHLCQLAVRGQGALFTFKMRAPKVLSTKKAT